MGNSIPPTSLTWVIREVKPRVKLQPGRILFFIQKRIFKSANIRPERQKKGPQPTKRFFSSSNSTRFTQFVPLSFLCSVFLDCWDCFCFRGSLFSPLDFPQCQCDPFPHWLALHWVKIPAGTPINYWCISGLCSMFCCCCYWCLHYSDADFIFSVIDTADGTKTSLIKPVGIGDSPSLREIIFKINNFSRVIVFIIGGATFSEARCGYEISRDKENSWEVIVGGDTHILTPEQFLSNVQNFGTWSWPIYLYTTYYIPSCYIFLYGHFYRDKYISTRELFLINSSWNLI